MKGEDMAAWRRQGRSKAKDEGDLPERKSMSCGSRTKTVLY